jgi:hypothetical protein
MKVEVHENEELVTYITRISEYACSARAIEITEEEWKEFSASKNTYDRLLGIFRDRDDFNYKVRQKEFKENE